MNRLLGVERFEKTTTSTPVRVQLWKRWGARLVLVFGALLVSLALAEMSVRFVAPQPTGMSHQDRYGLPLHYPGITRYLPQYGHVVSFNRVGMRDREHSVQKPAGVFRILLLGDSFMEAVQVPFEASLASLLERNLASVRGKRVEVINAGVSGWGTDDELRYLTRYGLRYKPDLVVVAITLHNDVSDNLRETWHTVVRGVLQEKQVPATPFWRYQQLRVKSFIATRFQLYQLWRRVRHGGQIRRAGRALNTHVLDLFREKPPAEIERGIALTDHLLAALRDTTRAAGGQVALVLLPIRYQLADSAFVEFARHGTAAQQELAIGRPQIVMGEIAGRLEIPVIDLLPKFREWTASNHSDPLFLEWDGHWNEAGHRLATQVVVAGLQQSGLLR
jgi:hypothetical protein